MQKLINTERKFFEIPYLLGETDGNQWIFRGSTASHEVRWKKFGDVMLSLIDEGKSNSIPQEVKWMVGYLKAIDDFKRHRLDRTEFRPTISSDGEFKSAIVAHVKKIADIRHKAVYQNLSYDVFTYAALRSKQDIGEFIEARMKFIREFAWGLL